MTEAHMALKEPHPDQGAFHPVQSPSSPACTPSSPKWPGCIVE